MAQCNESLPKEILNKHAVQALWNFDAVRREGTAVDDNRARGKLAQRRFRVSVAALPQSREHVPKGSAHVTFLPLSLTGKGGLLWAQMEAWERYLKSARPAIFGFN